MVVSSLEIQRRFMQTKVHSKFLHWSLCKPSKVAAAKNFSPSVHVTDTTCFYEYFSFPMITERHYFLQKFVVTLRFFQPTY